MNKEYVLYEDKAIVSNEEGKLRKTEISDNLDELLAQENVVESIINSIESRHDLMKNYPYPESKIKDVACLASAITAGVLLSYFLNGGPLLGTLKTFAGLINAPLLITSGGLLLFGVLSIPFAIYDRIQRKGYRNMIKGIENSIVYLTKRLNKEMDKLDELRESKNLIQVSNSTDPIEVVDAKETIDDVNKRSATYMGVGYNPKKYYRWYEKGLLDKKIGEEYGKMCEDCLEEEGKRLVKDFKPRLK